MDSNFSPKVKEIISYSREEALRLGNDFIGTEHLLLGLIREGDGMAIKILRSLGVDTGKLRRSIEDAVEKFIMAAQRFHSTYDPAPGTFSFFFVKTFFLISKN